MDKLTLNNQVTIPLTGLGVYQINNLDECEHTVLNALKMGYRLIDTAACYGFANRLFRFISYSYAFW